MQSSRFMVSSIPSSLPSAGAWSSGVGTWPSFTLGNVSRASSADSGIVGRWPLPNNEHGTIGVAHHTSGIRSEQVLGEVRVSGGHDDGVTADMVNSGDFEIQVAGERYPASASLRSMYDPNNLRVRL